MKPEYISARKEGSFAYRTITKRLPYIIRQVIENNELDKSQKQRLEDLIAEIPHSRFKSPVFIDGDYDYWKKFIERHSGTWLEEPFIDVEFYMYRRIAEAVDFFSNEIDHFGYAKLESLHSNIGEVIDMVKAISTKQRPFRELLVYNLWGNRADLSQFNQPGSYLSGSNVKNLVTNDIDKVIKFLENKLNQVDVFLDNSGLELAVDLIFVHYLLETGAAEKVWLHAKRYPIFVSDVMTVDVIYTIEYFTECGDVLLKNIGEKLAAYIESKTVQIETDPFWTLPEIFENLPPRLREHLKKSDLVISKGDLNYRRLVDDRCWPFNTDPKDATGYFPTSILTVRSLKSELMLGVNDEKARRLFEEDPDWLVNGKYGMVELIIK